MICEAVRHEQDMTGWLRSEESESFQGHYAHWSLAEKKESKIRKVKELPSM
jgi:hypothetical protein